MLPFLLQELALYWISTRFLSPNTGIGLFYATTLAVALGRSGRRPVFIAFLADQFLRGNHDIEGKKKKKNLRTNFWWNIISILAVIIAFALSSFTWATKFFISALQVMFASLLLFFWIFFLYKLYYFYSIPIPKPFLAPSVIYKLVEQRLSTLVIFGPFYPFRSNSIYFSHSVLLGPFGYIRSSLSTLIVLVHFGQLRFYSVHYIHFCPIQSTLV